MSAVIIVTVGNTDIQAVVKSDRDARRVSLRKGDTRNMHQRLLDGRINLSTDETLCNLPQLDGEDERDFQIGLGGDQIRPSRRLEELGYRFADAYVPGLLGRHFSWIKENREQISAVIVLSTHRDTHLKRNILEGEPIAAGPLMARWFAQVIWDETITAQELEVGGTPQNGCAYWLNFLIGDEDLHEQQEAGAGQYLLPRAAWRIDQTIAKFAKLSGVDTGYLAYAGGFPDVKVVASVSTYWHFSSVKIIPVSATGHPGVVCTQPSIITPSEEIYERRRAHELILQGKFSAAAEIATLGSDETALSGTGEWRILVRAVDRALSGDEEGVKRLVQGPRPAWFKPLVQNHPRCLRLALLTEAALRQPGGSGIAEAAAKTSSFVEVALLDVLSKVLPNGAVDWQRTQVKRQVITEIMQANADVAMTRALRENTIDAPSWRQRYDLRTSDLGGDFIQWYLRVEQDEAHRELLCAMKALWSALNAPPPGSGNRPKDYRNKMEHGGVTARWVNGARGAMEASKLWAPGERESGARFLGQPLIEDVLTNLGVGEPLGVYKGIVDGLTARIETYPGLEL